MNRYNIRRSDSDLVILTMIVDRVLDLDWFAPWGSCKGSLRRDRQIAAHLFKAHFLISDAIVSFSALFRALGCHEVGHQSSDHPDHVVGRKLKVALLGLSRSLYLLLELGNNPCLISFRSWGCLCLGGLGLDRPDGCALGSILSDLLKSASREGKKLVLASLFVGRIVDGLE